jgi:hypothetical protein
MPETTVTPPQTLVPTKSKVERAHHYLSIASTTIGILGAIGTLLVWLAANFYVGDLEVKLDRPVDELEVKVYDQKGKESVYHTTRFQLMPGTYEMDVVPAGGSAQRVSATVRFREKTVINVTVPGSKGESAGGDGAPEPRKRWWQFWRK